MLGKTDAAIQEIYTKNSPERGPRSSPDLDPDLRWPWKSSSWMYHWPLTSNQVSLRSDKNDFLAKF